MHRDIPVSSCPECGHRLELATGIGGDKAPEPGDISLCISCGAVNVFDPALQVVKPSPRRLREIMASKAGHQIRQAQIMIADRGPIPA